MTVQVFGEGVFGREETVSRTSTATAWPPAINGSSPLKKSNFVLEQDLSTDIVE